MLLDERFSLESKRKPCGWSGKERGEKNHEKNRATLYYEIRGISPLPTPTPLHSLAQICSLHLVGSLQSMKKVTQPRPSVAFHHAD